MKEVKQFFYSCYLLQSQSATITSCAYVGSTPYPKKRLRQHNGEIVGGAKKTRNKRPWDMIVVVYGFPSKRHALQFEWAWQKPHQSRFFKQQNVPGFSGKASEKTVNGKFNVLAVLMQLPPWDSMSLNVNFASAEFKTKFWEKIPQTLLNNRMVTVGSVDEIMNSILATYQLVESDASEDSEEEPEDPFMDNEFALCFLRDKTSQDSVEIVPHEILVIDEGDTSESDDSVVYIKTNQQTDTTDDILLISESEFMNRINKLKI